MTNADGYRRNVRRRRAGASFPLRMTGRALLGLVLLLVVGGSFGSAAGQDLAEAERGYDRLLTEYVDGDGLVDYAALADRPAGLDAYVQSLAQPGLLHEGQPAHQRLATLLNAYNAFTLKLIVDHYDEGRLRSITDLHGGKPWDRPDWTLSGQRLSLNQIEHELIRPVFAEPRIHWALVCAAYSCPPLRQEAYAADRLEQQLADQERRVLLADDPRFIRVDDDDRSARVTPLFDWYGQDFGDWRDYINQRRPGSDLKIAGFLEYDWTLNDQSAR